MAALIFDFDGTIADSRDYIIEFIAKDAKKYPLTAAERHALYGMSILKIARHLGYSWWRLPSLLLKGRSSMARSMKSLKPYDGILEIIKKLHSEGHQVFIVSSNSVANIKSFLKHQHAKELIMAVYGGIEIFGKGPVLHDLIREFNFEPENVVCIGDEIRDIEAAKSVGLKTVAVTWGFASVDDLKLTNPTWISETPKELMHVLEQV